jgi:hypothetical protein
MVAIFGSIIPAPLTIPTIRAPLDVKVWDRTFGNRSVVQMAMAALSAEMDCKFCIATGTISVANSVAGNLHPITPVEDGSTDFDPCDNCNVCATASQTNSAFPTPSPPEQTLDTLLLMTKVWIGPFSSNRCRPTMTGAPGN